jgi:hypothetical protein
MPLVPVILEKGFLDIINNPPANPREAADKMSQVYGDYAKAAASVFGPAAFTGAEQKAMASVLAGGFNPNGAAPAASGGIVGGITAFWLSPPVVFGAGVATVVPGPVLSGCLSVLGNTKIPAGQAAKILANCFDTLTRATIVISGAPPFAGPII